MAKVVCKECGIEYKSLSSHVKTHGLTYGDYLHKHFPRRDKLTGELIVFESQSQYFESDFNSRDNLSKWIVTAPKEEAVKSMTKELLRRKNEKNLTFTPTQVELRSLKLPGKKFLNELVGDFESYCQTLGYRKRYFQNHFEKPLKDISSYKIIVDTREQLPLTFSMATERKGLRYGDYRLSFDKACCWCYIERKSVEDFYQTLVQNFERFEREIQRAVKDGAYLIVLVESVLRGIFEWVARNHFLYKPQYVSDIHADRHPNTTQAMFSNMRKLIAAYPEVQFLFVDGRTEASRVIEKIFASNCEYRKVDLQFAYDTGNL